MSQQLDHRFHLLSGTVTFNRVYVTEGDPIGMDRLDLTEDLMQVEYPNNIILDLGWYGSFGEDGCFFVYLIKNSDWGRPLAQIPCQTVLKAIEIMNSMATLISIVEDEMARSQYIDKLYGYDLP